VSTAIEVRASGNDCGNVQVAPSFDVFVNGNLAGSYTTSGALADYVVATPVPTYVDEIGVFFSNSTEVGACITSMTVDSILVNGTRIASTNTTAVIRDRGFSGFEPFDDFDVLPAGATLSEPGAWRFFVAPLHRPYSTFGQFPALMSR